MQTYKDFSLLAHALRMRRETSLKKQQKYTTKKYIRNDRIRNKKKKKI